MNKNVYCEGSCYVDDIIDVINDRVNKVFCCMEYNIYRLSIVIIYFCILFYMICVLNYCKDIKWGVKLLYN